MPPKAHAVLSASSSSRWLHCTPSARLCETYEDKTSDFAAEGTDAHELCEYRLKEVLGIKADNPIEKLAWFNEEMDECANEYASYVFEQLEIAKQTCSDPTILIEQQVDFSRWVNEGFGTADCIIISDGVMNVIDYKHGKGVGVSAVNNPQMMLYALGSLVIFDGIYDIESIRMTIFQPRKSNVSVFEMSKTELLKWAEDVLTPNAKLAFEGKGKFHSGEWCRFCKAKAECRERANANLELTKYEFKEPVLLENSEISVILGKIDELTSWASDVKNYALSLAMSGESVTGWKLVAGRSIRKYIDENAVANVVSNAGFDPFEKKVIGITAMQKLLGKHKFDEMLSSLVEKPQGKPTLVPESDKRPEFKLTQNIECVKKDFMEEI